MSITLRAASLAEVERLIEIEDDAGRMYADVGLPDDLEGLAPDAVRAAIEAGRVWVGADTDDRAIAFALCTTPGDSLHLRELDVDPSFMRRGIGRRLIEHVCGEARALDRPCVTLTTFRDVPWNAPYYARYGFEVVAPDAQPPWLAAIRAEEDAGELARWPRVAMVRRV